MSLSVAEVVAASNALKRVLTTMEQESRTSLHDQAGQLREMSEKLMGTQVEITFEPPYADLAEEFLLFARQDPELMSTYEANMLGSVLAKLRP